MPSITVMVQFPYVDTLRCIILKEVMELQGKFAFVLVLVSCLFVCSSCVCVFLVLFLGCAVVLFIFLQHNQDCLQNGSKTKPLPLSKAWATLQASLINLLEFLLKLLKL